MLKLQSMTEENQINFSTQQTQKRAIQAILKMAQEWNKSPNTLHHAITSYKNVIRQDPETVEAGEARAALLKIADSWDKKGQKYSAMRLYQELI